jgi:hypothetical protein
VSFYLRVNVYFFELLVWFAMAWVEMSGLKLGSLHLFGLVRKGMQGVIFKIHGVVSGSLIRVF